ncbi:MAG: hypothetical protein V4597_11775 [Pseudomonadota bacterium]
MFSRYLTAALDATVRDLCGRSAAPALASLTRRVPAVLARVAALARSAGRTLRHAGALAAAAVVMALVLAPAIWEVIR